MHVGFRISKAKTNDDFTIETEEIIYIEKGNRHSYTFLITTDESDSKPENLVLNYEEGAYTAYRVTYDFTPEQLANPVNLDLDPIQVKVRVLEDFDLSAIYRKKPEPCVTWEYKAAGWNEQGQVTHRELLRVVDQDCLDQLNSGGQTSSSTTSGGVRPGGWGGWMGTGLNTGVYGPPTAADNSGYTGGSSGGHPSVGTPVFTRPVFPKMKFANYIKSLKESLKTVVPNSFWWRSTSTKKIVQYLEEHFDNQTGLIDIKASEFIVSCVNYLSGNDFSNESQNFIVSLIEQVRNNLTKENEDQWPENIMLFSAINESIIVDIEDYLKCFQLNQSAVFTLYVDQPTANSSDSWSGGITNPNVGHTFVSLKQEGIRRVLGFYPSQGVNPFTNPSTKSVLIDDDGHIFDVSISVPIHAIQLQNIINYIKNYSKTYNLNTNNCTDFGMYLLSQTGISVPPAIGSWPGGSGNNPGQMGQNIREIALPANTKRNITGGFSLSNSGNCN